MPWGVVSESRTLLAVEGGPDRLPPIKGRFARKIQVAINRMLKESSTLSVHFPCAADISLDHGKLLTTTGPARALPVGYVTSSGFTLSAFSSSGR